MRVFPAQSLVSFSQACHTGRITKQSELERDILKLKVLPLTNKANSRFMIYEDLFLRVQICFYMIFVFGCTLPFSILILVSVCALCAPAVALWDCKHGQSLLCVYACVFLLVSHLFYITHTTHTPVWLHRREVWRCVCEGGGHIIHPWGTPVGCNQLGQWRVIVTLLGTREVIKRTYKYISLQSRWPPKLPA